MKTLTCDRCKADVTTTGARPGFRLCLSIEALPNTGGMVYGVAVCPPLKYTETHFCGLKCLQEFIADTDNQYGIFPSKAVGK